MPSSGPRRAGDPGHDRTHKRAPATTGRRKASAPSPTGFDYSEKLTVHQICVELQISRSTFYDWRQKGRGPRCIRLPNGDLRVSRRDFDRWLDAQETQ